MLTHTSGLPPVLPLKPKWKGYQHAINLCYSASINKVPGQYFRYSDVNFILLGEIIQKISGVSLKSFVEKEIFDPLEMKDTCFLPSKSNLYRIAPTTKEKGKLVHGIVHDPTARAMGGIAGHAGLFTTASDLAKYCRMIINNGSIGDIKVLSKNSIDIMTKIQTSMVSHKVGRGLGGISILNIQVPAVKVFLNMNRLDIQGGLEVQFGFIQKQKFCHSSDQ